MAKDGNDKVPTVTVGPVVVTTTDKNGTKHHDWPKVAVDVKNHDWPKLKVRVKATNWPANKDLPKEVEIDFDLTIDEN